VIGLVIAAALVALGCAAACITRLVFVTSPIAIHPAVWRACLERGEGERVVRAAAKNPSAAWERELVAALKDPNEEARAGRINEQLAELDFRLTRWERVPRVCASIASSAGFLFGSLMLRFGLIDADSGEGINDVVLQAINVAAFGVAGAAFAIAAQVRARKVVQAQKRNIDALIETLEH
jgi:hypothetical protein